MNGGLSVTRDAHIRACAVCDSDLGGSAHGLVMGLVPSPAGLVDLGVPSSSPNPSREPEEVSQPQLTRPEGGARRIALSARSTSTDVPACLASNDATWNGPEDRTKPGLSSITRRTWTDRDLQLGQSTLRAAAREEGPPALLPLGGFQWWVPRQLNSRSRLKSASTRPLGSS